MGNIFDFSGIEKSEQTIRKTWSEFRECLANGLFSYDEIEKAKKQTFLKVYDDLFHKHSGIDHKTIALKKSLKNFLLDGACILIQNYYQNKFLNRSMFAITRQLLMPHFKQWLNIIFHWVILVLFTVVPYVR